MPDRPSRCRHRHRARHDPPRVGTRRTRHSAPPAPRPVDTVTLLERAQEWDDANKSGKITLRVPETNNLKDISLVVTPYTAELTVKDHDTVIVKFPTNYVVDAYGARTSWDSASNTLKIFTHFTVAP
jgi:hypothetical protein